MDIHRSRFVPYPASAINALAFSHTTGEGLRSDDQNSDLRLAVGRANGDIEIWNPSKGEWLQETIFRGGRDRSVEGLAWVQEPDDIDKRGKLRPGKLRLFSIGYSSTVTEWDLTTGLPKRNSSGTFAEVWCLAAQPRVKRKDKIAGKQPEQVEQCHGQNLAAGCADGTLAILSTADDDLQFRKFLSTPTAKRARCLSVTFRDRDVVVAGFADSTIRIFDSRNSSLLRTVSLTAGAAGAPREVLVWAVKCLPNGDIVAGDSTGEVRFFDGKNFSQYQRITGHDADALDIAVRRDGKSIWSTGMDRRTVLYVNNATSSSGRQWARASHRIHHEHDVKAMATFENKRFSMIASGGLDTNLVILPMRGYGTEYHRTISGLPQCQPLLSLPSRRLLIAWWNRDISIWRVCRRHHDSKPYKLVAKIVLKGEENITSATVATFSETAHVLGVSTAAEIKLFSLIEHSSGALAIKKLSHKFPQHSARIVQFSADGKWMAIATHRNEIYVARFLISHRKVVEVISTPILLKQPKRRPTAGQSQPRALGAYTHVITRLQFSPDSRVLAVGKLDGYVDGWILAGHEDATAPEVDIPEQASSDTSNSDLSGTEDEVEEKPPIMIYGQFWSRIPGISLLPKLDSPPHLISFRPSPSQSGKYSTAAGESSVEPNGNPAVHPTRSNPRPIPHYVPKGPYHLVVLTAHHHLYEFDLLEGRLTDWSNRNPTSRLPNQFRQVRDRAVGCLWQTSMYSQRWWLWGVNWVWMFDLSQDLPASASSSSNQANGINGGMLASKKRKRDESGAGGPIKRKDMQGLGLVATKLSVSIPLSQPQADGAVGKLRESDDEEVMLEPQMDTDSGEATSEQQTFAKIERRKTWFSFKYRPILGIVPIGDDADNVRDDETKKLEETSGIDLNGLTEGKAAEEDPVEVVLVERPVWDLDLPPRYEVRYKQ